MDLTDPAEPKSRQFNSYMYRWRVCRGGGGVTGEDWSCPPRLIFQKFPIIFQRKTNAHTLSLESFPEGLPGGGGGHFIKRFVSALSQSDARISVAYKISQWKSLTKRLMKCPLDIA